MDIPNSPLGYGIEGCSSYSDQYRPEQILEDRPTDQSSRWSSASSAPGEFVLLKLDQPSIVQTMSFGKFHKVHVCNLKELKIFGGLQKSNMRELWHGGLQNDAEKETVQLKFLQEGAPFPVRFIRIEPLVTYGQNFHFSVWHVAFSGTNDPSILRAALKKHTENHQRRVMRICLKHLRQCGFTEIFETLAKETGLSLEDELATQLHDKLIGGKFDDAEQILQTCCERGMFDIKALEGPVKPEWTRLVPPDTDKDNKEPVAPGKRGGHDMIMDHAKRQIILFGGWDGENDLGDLWVFDTLKGTWKLISDDTRKVGGPSPRSCHKMCFNETTRTIYSLGRYVEPDASEEDRQRADFFSYHIDTDRWTELTANTRMDGGPALIYDHQICCDCEKNMIYVYGGRTVRQPGALGQLAGITPYSGLYRYDIAKKEWSCIFSARDFSGNGGPMGLAGIQLRPRMGHSMVLDSKRRALYIFAGQRFNDYLSDFYSYSLDTGFVSEVSRDSSRQGGPDAGFTQRAAFSPHLGEFYCLSGLVKAANVPDGQLGDQESVKNTFWIYRVATARWTRVYANEHTEPEYWESMKDKEPCPRFAHQLVYDPVTEDFYMFGGNPGNTMTPKERLDDFWRLHLARDKPNNVLRRTKRLIREQQFFEMCFSGDVLAAMKYLQNDVSSVVDHTDEEESTGFRALSARLFSNARSGLDDEPSGQDKGKDEDGVLSNQWADALLNSSSTLLGKNTTFCTEYDFWSALRGAKKGSENEESAVPSPESSSDSPTSLHKQSVVAHRLATFNALLDYFDPGVIEPKETISAMLP